MIQRKEVEKYSHIATLDELIENDYNLNIPRYVDTFEEEEPVDLIELSNEMSSLNEEMTQAETDFLTLFNELSVTDETKELIEATKAVFK